MTQVAALSRPEMFAKIQEAQKHSPEAFQLLKKIAIVTASVALGILLAIPTALIFCSFLREVDSM